MTTQVTVQYDGDRLLERSRQQQQAARQVKASSDRIKAAASTDKAQQQRAGTLPQQKAQRYGTLEQRLRVRDEPAAWRLAQGYDVAGVAISGLLNGKPSNEQIRTVTLSTVGATYTQAFDLYEFPFEPGYNNTGVVYNTGRTSASHSNALTSSMPSNANLPITNPLFAAAAAAGLPSIKTTNNIQRNVESDENYVIAHLPLARGLMVLSIAGRYGGVATIRNEVLTETVHSQTQPTLNPNPLSETTSAYFRNLSTQLTVANSEEAAQTGDYAKSWLITPTTIEEIPTPLTLKTKLLAYVPEYTYATSSAQTAYAITNRTYTDAGMYYAFDQPFETPPNQSPQPTRISQEGRVYLTTYSWFGSPSTGEGLYVFCDYASTSQTATRKVATKTQAAATPIFYDSARYGLWSYASVSACYSPGVYAQLDNTSISYDSALNEDTGYLASSFMPSYALPRVALQAVVRQDASNNNFKRFDIRRPMSNTLAAESTLRENKSKQASFTEYNDYDFVWDWGRPAFCRTKLLALGFTEADLTP
jgi:hypothetical protein